MDLAELEELLGELRHVRTDHQGVEAKRAGEALPESTHETLSAFANTDGGLLLLGVDEAGGEFAVTGVGDAKQAQSDLQAVCALMDPPLRATMDLIAHPDGVVVAAFIPSVPREQRPCHLAKHAAEQSSFVRVGDGDQKLSAAEVAQMRANRSGHDHSASPAPDGSELDPALVRAFTGGLRAASPRYADLPEPLLLHTWGATTARGRPTYAGLLTLGLVPQLRCAAARVTYRRLPRRTDPAQVRYAGKHLEGTVGELLDDTLAAVAADLDTVQVARGGHLYDELDVPGEALREVMSNALIHRSLADGQRDTSVLVEVSDEAVVVTSPGSLHVSADPATLGLAPMAGVRNLSLVRLGEQLRTPSGGRIVEHQTSGIAAADRACHAAGTMPALFVDHPARFQAILLRGRLDGGPGAAALAAAAMPATDDRRRLLAVLHRLEQVREHIAVSGLGSIVFDARLGARALAPRSPEDAAAELRALEDAGVLRRTRTRNTPAWVEAPAAGQPEPAPPAPAGSVPTQAPVKRGRGRPRGHRVPEVLAAVEAAPGGVLAAKGIGEALGLSSPTSRNRWIRASLDAGLIVSTVENPFDPHGGYRLTLQGRKVLEAERRKA